jgi:hypothetical protein
MACHCPEHYIFSSAIIDYYCLLALDYTASVLSATG